jgi:hypothetical protein
VSERPDEEPPRQNGGTWQVAAEGDAVVFVITIPNPGDPMRGLKIDLHLSVERSAELRSNLEMAENVIRAKQSAEKN